jgi:hypothetical protein
MVVMEYRQLGRSGLRVSTMAMGTMTVPRNRLDPDVTPGAGLMSGGGLQVCPPTSPPPLSTST